MGSCTLALGSLLAALHYCYGLPVDGVNLEGMTEYLETHDMFLDVVDVEDFMEFVDVEQIVLDNGVVR